MSPSTAGRLGTAVRTLDRADKLLCVRFNRMSRWGPVRGLFRTVSRLGDGIIWYSMMAMLPVIGGMQGLYMTVHMALTGLAGVTVYKTIKHFSGRERPFIGHAEQVSCIMPPLDRYSFPSGHTLHAVAFSLVLCSYFPEMAWILLPLTVLVALSRMVLGLHYPSDVLAGALVGGLLAAAGIDIVARFGG